MTSMNVRRVTKMTLETHNDCVLEANDGPEALAIFAQHKDSISVVLTDLIMPYIDGVALIRALKQIKPGYDFHCVERTGRRASPGRTSGLGVVNFLRKPARYEEAAHRAGKRCFKAIGTARKKMISAAQDQSVARF